MKFYKNQSFNIITTYLPTPLSIFYIFKSMQQSSRKLYFS